MLACRSSPLHAQPRCLDDRPGTLPAPAWTWIARAAHRFSCTSRERPAWAKTRTLGPNCWGTLAMRRLPWASGILAGTELGAEIIRKDRWAMVSITSSDCLGHWSLNLRLKGGSGALTRPAPACIRFANLVLDLVQDFDSFEISKIRLQQGKQMWGRPDILKFLSFNRLHFLALSPYTILVVYKH